MAKVALMPPITQAAIAICDTSLHKRHASPEMSETPSVYAAMDLRTFRYWKMARP